MTVEAGIGLRGPGLEPVRAGEQTGMAARTGQLGCGQPEDKEGVERGEQNVCLEWTGQE